MTLAEAKQRIREAAEFGSLELELHDCADLRDLSALSTLTALRKLNLRRCAQIGDLSPLSMLNGLQSLNLEGCRLISDLSPLSALTALHVLNLGRCPQITDLSPLLSLTALKSLDLYGCGQLSDIRPLSALTALQELNLEGCIQLSDLSPLSTLTALHSLDLEGCGQVSDLGPLSALVALTSLDLYGCEQITDLTPLLAISALESLELGRCGRVSDLSQLSRLPNLKFLRALNTGVTRLPSWVTERSALEVLWIDGLEDVPQQLQSHREADNCLLRLQAWSRDLRVGEKPKPEAKVLILGEAGVGKTQLCRFLRLLPYDDKVPTTHGVLIAQVAAKAEPICTEAELNIWDFGGQDIYHGTHALFMDGHAIFILLWKPEDPHAGQSHTGETEGRQRPLAYWLDFVRQLAGTNPHVIIVQSQCEERSDERPMPEGLVAGFLGLRTLAFSARTRRGSHALSGTLRDAVEEQERCHPSPLLGRGWVTVRDELRRLAMSETRTIDLTEFEDLCAKSGGVSNSKVLLEFLHRTGVVFFRDHLFKGKIIVDQKWALFVLVLTRKSSVLTVKTGQIFERR
jgi:internalin A